MPADLATGGDHGRSGVRFLRRLTVYRALREYLRWIGRAVGWWMVGYLIFWLVVFGVAGYQSLPDPPPPLPLAPAQVWSLALTLLLLTALLTSRAPPVSLDVRDVYRLALSPARPRTVMRWPFTRSGALRLLIGLALGGSWTVLATAWFPVVPLWAGPAAALLLISQLNLRWLLYAERGSRGAGRRAARSGALLLVLALLLAAVGWLYPALGLAAAMYLPNPLSLLGPLALAGLTALAVRRSLRERFPPHFTRQSFVLGQLNALRTFELMSRLGGFGGSADPGERVRLRALLFDMPGAVAPVRSLPLPGANRPAWWAIAWRTLLAHYRLPLLGQVATLGLVTAIAFTSPLPQAAAAGIFVPAMLLALTAQRLLGPGRYPKQLPLSPLQRTLGRCAPGVSFAAGWFLLVLIVLPSTGLPGAGSDPAVVFTLVPLVFVLLEKASAWSGGAPNPETVVAAAVLGASPAFLAAEFAVPGITAPLQLSLALLVLVLPV